MVKNKTRKQKKVLCYTGIGSKPDGVHTSEEFLKVADKFAKSKDDCYSMINRKYVCPEKGNLDKWIEWTGAEYMDEKTCRASAKEIQKDVADAKKESYKLAKKTLANINSGKFYKDMRKINAMMGKSESHTRKIVKKMKKIYEKILRDTK